MYFSFRSEHRLTDRTAQASPAYVGVPGTGLGLQVVRGIWTGGG